MWNCSCYYSSLQYRRVLYDMFTKNYRLRRNMIQTRLAEELGDAPKADIDRLLNVRRVMRLNICFYQLLITDLTWPLSFQECCKSQGGMWYLKGTIQSWHGDPAPCGHCQPFVSSPRCPVGGQTGRCEPIASCWALRMVMGEQRCQPWYLLCSEPDAFLVLAEAFLTLTQALWRSTEDRVSSHTQSINWKSLRWKNEDIEIYNYGLWVDFWI